MCVHLSTFAYVSANSMLPLVNINYNLFKKQHYRKYDSKNYTTNPLKQPYI